MRASLNIWNRRYIGCKQKLTDFIFDSITELLPDKDAVFADIFAGTGAVGYRFASKGYKTILNDTLRSNTLAYEAFLGSEEIDEASLVAALNGLSCLNGANLEPNYFSVAYGGKYFTDAQARQIGHIRELIALNPGRLNKRSVAYLLTSLMYGADRIANTVGHYESYLLKEPENRGRLELLPLKTEKDIIPAEIHEEDANALVRHIKCDIAYIDPPYNARQYVNCYHVLENLARWEKPELKGKAAKFDRENLKSGYCRVKAPELMADLINNLDCRLIAVSYNNTYKARSATSVDTISAEEITNMLSKRGKVTVREKDYNPFDAGKTTLTGHKERLYLCETNTPCTK